MTEAPAVPMPRHRGLIRALGSPWLKGAVAVGIMWLLVHFNRLDWRALTSLESTWPWLLGAFALMLPPFAIVSYRFQLILRGQRINVPMASAVRWTMIGSLFDLVMPSSNGGDVIKAGYVVHHVGAGTRTRAVTAVAIDRVLGLLGLFLLASIVSALNWRVVLALPGGLFLLVTSVGATFGMLAVFRLLGARRVYHHHLLNDKVGSADWAKRLKEFIGAFNDLRERPACLYAALGLSVFNHCFWCLSLLCIARAVGNEVPAIEGFAVFPLAIFGNVFGVAGGFGVGTAAFDMILSQLLGVGNGALIGLVFQALSGMSKLCGLPFYLGQSNRKRTG